MDSLFDVQVKRIHEYKRQLLNLLYVVTRYHRLRGEPEASAVPRTVIFAGKAAPGYVMAKGIIKLINNVAQRRQRRSQRSRASCGSCSCPTTTSRWRSASCRRRTCREQISTAGMEASGTGNMKLSLNGALTIGTLDGANIEIREQVGRGEHLHLRPARPHEVDGSAARGYSPREIAARRTPSSRGRSR